MIICYYSVSRESAFFANKKKIKKAIASILLSLKIENTLSYKYERIEFI